MCTDLWEEEKDHNKGDKNKVRVATDPFLLFSFLL